MLNLHLTRQVLAMCDPTYPVETKFIHRSNCFMRVKLQMNRKLSHTPGVTQHHMTTFW